MKKNKRKLIIIDCNSVIHRAYYALPPLKDKKGEVVNAVYGFLLVFLKALKEFKPNFITACFDLPGPTFRHKEFKEYKAKRLKAPEELYQQMPKVKEVLRLFNVPVFEKKGFEADDLIGTLSTFTEKKGANLEAIILSGDSDVFQLLNKNVKVYSLRSGVKNTILYDTEKFKENYGFLPSQMVDYKALRGDASDNIPGAPGVGEKTAIKILEEFGDIDNLYKNLKKKTDLKERIKEILIDNKKQVLLSRHLAKIKLDVPLKFNIKDGEWNKYSKEKVIRYFEKMGFESLIKRIPGEENRGKLKLW